MKRSLKYILRFRLILIFTLIGVKLFSQETITISDVNLPNTRGYDRNPVALVHKLTDGVASEKEKFDILFTWVVKNIRYDLWSYSSANGASKQSIKRTLRRKSGLCLDYAALMDTLCSLAGITNVSVLGYSKGSLFDVNDSIYIDNHAWNAVELNGKWFLYDVTWSAGEYVPKYRWLSRLVIKIQEKLLKKTKIKTYTFKPFVDPECGKSPVEYTSKREVLPFFRRILYTILELKKLRYRQVFVKVKHLNYYLTQPEVFAIDHFPDNPYWSLTSKIKTLSDFEGDSTLYYMNDSIYKKQERGGRTCYACDKYLSQNKLERATDMKANSIKFNPRNGFITWLSDIEIASFYFDKSTLTDDSLTKINLIDSSLMHIAYARSDLKDYQKSAREESRFHKLKNDKKKNTLLKENGEHTSEVLKIIGGIFKEYRLIKMMKHQKDWLLRESDFQRKKLKKIVPKKVILKKSKPTKIANLQKQLELSLAQSVRIDSSIADLSISYAVQKEHLYNNLWKKRTEQYQLISLFNTCSFLRRLYYLDDYKRIVKERRAKLNKVEKEYLSKIKDSILVISDTCRHLSAAIIKLEKKKAKLVYKSAQLINSLIQEGALKTDSLMNFVASYRTVIKERKCQLSDDIAQVEAIKSRYYFFAKQQREILKFIRYENRSEVYRHKQIHLKIENQRRKHFNIGNNNRSVTNEIKKMIIKTKKEYLKRLKLERKKRK